LDYKTIFLYKDSAISGGGRVALEGPDKAAARGDRLKIGDENRTELDGTSGNKTKQAGIS
jgi:hypothetical protein